MKKLTAAKIVIRVFVWTGIAVWLLDSACAATLTVTTTNDNGPGSLRQAILDVASNDTVNFSVTGAITLTTGELLITNDLAIIGPGATILAVSGNNASRVLEITSNVTASISGLTIRDGHASDGTNNSNPFFPGGDGSSGGGIYNAGTLTLNACIVSGNSSGVGGGGGGDSCGSPPGGNGGHGGGIYNGGTLTLTACTLNGNSAGAGYERANAVFGHAIGNGGNGGNGGGICNANTLTLTACTFSGNSAGSGGGGDVCGSAGGLGGNGGGIYNTNTLTLTACTFGGNSSGSGGSGGFSFGFWGGPGGNGGSGGAIFNASNASTAYLRSVLVALDSVGVGGPGGVGNLGPGLPGSEGVGPDLDGSFTSLGYNFIRQTDGGTGFTNGVKGDLVGTSSAPLDPKLGPLQNNGGPTYTMALLPGSPAIDQGSSAGPAADQRGRPRPIDKAAVTNAVSGDASDIGAYEVQLEETWLTGPMKRGSDYVVSFASEVGLRYRAECKDDLGPGAWTVVADNVAGTGAILQITDPGAASQPKRFYRGIVLP